MKALKWLGARLAEPSTWAGVSAVTVGIDKAATAAGGGDYLVAAACLLGGAIAFCKAESIPVPAALTEAAAILPPAK
jgi:hypothetical protein